MVVCEDIKTIFIAVPKTGTRTIYDVLDKNFNTIHLEDHRVNVPDKYKNYFTFITKRNPYDRFVSIWWSTTNRSKTIKRKNLRDLMGSDKSIHKFCKIFPKIYNTEPIFRSQTIYTNNKIDKILDFDNLENDFLDLDFIKNINVKNIPFLNVTDGQKKDDIKERIYRNNWSQYIDEKVKETVMKYYTEDFNHFNYKI